MEKNGVNRDWLDEKVTDKQVNYIKFLASKNLGLFDECVEKLIHPNNKPLAEWTKDEGGTIISILTNKRDIDYYEDKFLPKMKACSGPICQGKEKPATAEYFSKNKSKKDGLQTYCRDCQTYYDKARREKKRLERNSAELVQCTGECGKFLPHTEEYFYHTGRGYGLRSVCITCYKKRNRERLANKINQQQGDTDNNISWEEENYEVPVWGILLEYLDDENMIYLIHDGLNVIENGLTLKQATTIVNAHNNL